MSNNPPHIKTPVTILQELVMKRGWPPPEYNVHERVIGVQTEFTYELEMMGMIANGTGKSKMSAKHETARHMLMLLLEDGIYSPPPEISCMLNVTAPSPSVVDDEGNSSSAPMEPMVDYVGLLSSNCAMFYMEQPHYELVSTMGPPHAREFTFTCTLMRKQIVVIESKKKIAKQKAAERMWSIYKSIFEPLQDLPVRPNLGISALNYETGFLEHIKDKYMSLERLKELFAPPFTQENLHDAFTELELEYELELLFQSGTEITYICNANACIDICSYGKGQTDAEARQNAVKEFYDVLYKYLDF